MSEPPATGKSHGRLSIGPNLRPRALMDGPPRLSGAWCAKVLTLFPETFPGVLGASLTGRALQQGLWALEPIDLRTFGRGRHRQVDDTPAGGGAGLVMRADVLGRALDMATAGTPDDPGRWPRVYLSPRGKPFTQADARR
ncbi:MAG: tRNA (guanosine(37)-N1)-methyltransferase TrmD, partial [Roseicyclus sp.]